MFPGFNIAFGKAGKLFQFLIYGMSALLGVLTLVHPVIPITAVIGIGLVNIYGITLALGGFLALIASIWPNFKIEITALFPLMTAWLVYDLAVWAIYFNRMHNPSMLYPPYGSAISGAIVFIFFVWRTVWLISGARQLTAKADHAKLLE
jgi:hypothetical protein